MSETTIQDGELTGTAEKLRGLINVELDRLARQGIDLQGIALGCYLPKTFCNAL